MLAHYQISKFPTIFTIDEPALVHNYQPMAVTSIQVYYRILFIAKHCPLTENHAASTPSELARCILCSLSSS